MTEPLVFTKSCTDKEGGEKGTVEGEKEREEQSG